MGIKDNIKKWWAEPITTKVVPKVFDPVEYRKRIREGWDIPPYLRKK